MSDDQERRSDVCEDCKQLAHREPLTCRLVTRRLQGGGNAPCPHKLAAMLSSEIASCPNPDAEWAARWKAAAVEEPRSVVVASKAASAPPELSEREKARAAMRQRRTRGVSRQVFRVGATIYDRPVAE